MKGIIIEKNIDNSVLLLSDGNVITVKSAPNLDIGSVVSVDNIMKSSAFNVKKLASMAASILLVVFIGLGVYAWKNPVQYINIDINPSIELSVNCFNRIISVNSLNDEGWKLVNSISLKADTYESGIQKIISSAKDLGYIREEGDILISISSNNKNLVERTQAKILEKIAERVEVMTFDTKEYIKSAENGMSPGKEAIIEKVIESGIYATKDDLMDEPVKELIKKWNENKNTLSASGKKEGNIEVNDRNSENSKTETENQVIGDEKQKEQKTKEKELKEKEEKEREELRQQLEKQKAEMEKQKEEQKKKQQSEKEKEEREKEEIKKQLELQKAGPEKQKETQKKKQQEEKESIEEAREELKKNMEELIAESKKIEEELKKRMKEEKELKEKEEEELNQKYEKQKAELKRQLEELKNKQEEQKGLKGKEKEEFKQKYEKQKAELEKQLEELKKKQKEEKKLKEKNNEELKQKNKKKIDELEKQIEEQKKKQKEEKERKEKKEEKQEKLEEQKKDRKSQKENINYWIKELDDRIEEKTQEWKQLIENKVEEIKAKMNQ